jgi:RNA polymerase sigma-70 factor (ECF subfamily)
LPWDPYTDESASEPEEVVAGSTRQRRSVDEEVLEYVSGLRRYALLLVGDPHDADDLVQECLVRVIAQARSWRRVKELRAYLFTTLHNLFVDGHRRRLKRRGDVPIETVIADLLAPPRQQDWVELRDLIAALQVLPKEQREVVLLVGLEGLSYLEAADVLGVPVGTVMSRLSRGREALRRLTSHGSTARLRVVK